MTVIFDLDHTLMDTTRLKDDLGACLEGCGISKDLFWKAYEEQAIQNERIRNFDVQRLLSRLEKFLSCELREAENHIRSVMNDTHKYLFPDVEWLLSSLKDDGHYLVLYTHGNEEWQQKKIDTSGIVKYFDEVVVTTGNKEDDDFPSKLKAPIVAVNDNGTEIMAMKAQWPEMYMIAVPGPKPPPTDPSIHISETLKDVYLTITHL